MLDVLTNQCFLNLNFISTQFSLRRECFDDRYYFSSCYMTHSAVYVKLLTYDQIRIRIQTDLCYEICIRRMRIFLGFVTSLI